MGKLAYHSVVHALEAKPDLTKQDRFALAITHAVDGHLPYERLVQAGRKHEQLRLGTNEIEASLKDWLATDLCPSAQLIRLLNTETALLAFFNEYDHALGNAVVTTLVSDTSFRHIRQHQRLQRSVPAHNTDPLACHAAGLMKAQILLAQVQSRVNKTKSERHVTQVTELGKMLGVEKSVGYEAAQFFEQNLGASALDLAQALNMHYRTLGRHLKRDGLNANAIRRTCMMNKAVQTFLEDKSLGDIAKECEFADQAHMSRTFKEACGLPPNTLRKLVHM